MPPGIHISDRTQMGEIEASDLEYHQRIVAKLREAEAMEQVIRRTRAAVEEWGEHLAEKYGLAKGDAVSEEGKITRQPPSPAV
jgi:hypothetical protein